MSLHKKIREIQLRAAPINYSTLVIDENGQLTDDVRDAEIQDRLIKGYLIVWGVRDTYGTMFMKGCCAKSIKEKGPNSEAKYKITMCWQHDITDPIGQFRVLKEDDYGLYFEAEMDDVPNGNRALYQVGKRTINQFSAGFFYNWDKMEYNEELEVVMLREIDLFEGSPVTMASISETYAVRSIEQLESEKAQLLNETEDFIKTLPRVQRLELRQLITRHISLSKAEPAKLPESVTTQVKAGGEPDEAAGIDYEFLRNNLKLFTE